MYQLEAPDCSGNVKKFEKPWLQTALMFIAMALCLPIAWIQQKWENKHHKQQQQQGDDGHAAHDVEEGQQGDDDGVPSSAAAALLKAAAISAAANAPAGSTATEDGNLTEPLLSYPHVQQQQQQQQRGGGGSNGGNNGSGGKKLSKFQEALLLCVPTGFDLAATTLMNVGLLYVAASGRVHYHKSVCGSACVTASMASAVQVHADLTSLQFLDVV